jgi:hypothetical protein
VLLDTDEDTSGKVQDTDQYLDVNALISAKDETIAALRRQLEEANERDRENRRLLAAALERIPPQLEAPTDSPSAATSGAEAAEEQQGRGQPRSDAPGPQEGARRPWWRRVFGR